MSKEIIRFLGKKCFRCDDDKNFYYDDVAKDLFCKLCGFRIKFREYMDRLNGNPEKLAAYILTLKSANPPLIPVIPAVQAEPVPPAETHKEEPKMSEKGTCPGCGRSGVAIISHGFCSACYPYAKKVKWDVAKVQEWRKDHPVIVRSPKGTHKTRKPKVSIGPAPVHPPVETFRTKTKTWLDIQIEEQVLRLQETIKGSGFRRAKIEAVIEITVKDVRVSLIP